MTDAKRSSAKADEARAPRAQSTPQSTPDAAPEMRTAASEGPISRGRLKLVDAVGGLNGADRSIQADLAMVLRVGLGAVFLIGGLAKLSRLWSPAAAEGIVTQYMGPSGYVNQLFTEWLFSGPLGAVLTPWLFLSALSAFELVAGAMLIAGLLIRPLALIWSLLLWSFVVSLPVVTTPGVSPDLKTYLSPALMVQIRDVTLSGLFVVLYHLGAGARSVDATQLGQPTALGRNWDDLGLLLRWSLALTFLIGGFFHGFHKVPTFATPALLLAAIGLGLLLGWRVRAFAAAGALTLLVFMASKLVGASGVLGYFNSVKREIGLLGGLAILALAGGGRHFLAVDALIARLKGHETQSNEAPGA
ncbi:MAG: DoxX family membrane protein [Neomegalonema sp.]|nr:DoxX family membrane protein [Neomegalonema sp.]